MANNTDTGGENGLSRRRYVTLGTVAVTGLAGCMGGGNGESSDSGTSSPEATTETFYQTLYIDNDIEAANALYHPDSESEPLAPANFEAFGGLEAITTEIVSTEIVSEEGEVTELHATVEYISDGGSQEDIDHLFLRQSDGEWLVDRWLPAAIREDG